MQKLQIGNKIHWIREASLFKFKKYKVNLYELKSRQIPSAFVNYKRQNHEN